jgi:hypothetical protein
MQTAVRRKNKIDLRELQRLCAEGRTNKWIAEYFHCSPGAVKKKRRKYGLLVRQVEESVRKERELVIKKMGKRWEETFKKFVELVDQNPQTFRKLIEALSEAMGVCRHSGGHLAAHGSETSSPTPEERVLGAAADDAG